MHRFCLILDKKQCPSVWLSYPHRSWENLTDTNRTFRVVHHLLTEALLESAQEVNGNARYASNHSHSIFIIDQTKVTPI